MNIDKDLQRWRRAQFNADLKQRHENQLRYSSPRPWINAIGITLVLWGLIALGISWALS